MGHRAPTARPARKDVADFTAAEFDHFKTHPAGAKAVELLNQALVIQTPNGHVTMEIVEVEPFASLLQKSHIEDFDKKRRNAGDVFLTWFRGSPQLNIVIDPEARSVVCVKSVKLDGKPATIPAALTLMGLATDKFKDRGAYRTAVDSSLDGKATDGGPRSKIRLVELAESTAAVLNIRRVVKGQAENSLGGITKL